MDGKGSSREGEDAPVLLLNKSVNDRDASVAPDRSGEGRRESRGAELEVEGVLGVDEGCCYSEGESESEKQPREDLR